MNRFRVACACGWLSLLQFAAVSLSQAVAFAPALAVAQGVAVADDNTYFASAMRQQPVGQAVAPCTVANSCDCQNCCSFYPGWFAGVGGSYNSVRVDSVFSGSGVTDIYDGEDLVAVGFAGGPAAPFRDTGTTFAPVLQLGYFQNFGNSEWLWGAKVSYKYLGITLSDDGFDAPQVGVYEEFDPPSTSTFTGNATTNSAQTIVDHEIAILPFIGREYKHGRVYVGGGPVVFDTKSKLYGLSSYADINGEHTNVGGRPLNLAASKWVWGGAAQIGVVYYLRPSCFLDFSYDFMVTGIFKNDWYKPVTSESNGLTYATGIHYREEVRLWAQSLNVTLNMKF